MTGEKEQRWPVAAGDGRGWQVAWRQVGRSSSWRQAGSSGGVEASHLPTLCLAGPVGQAHSVQLPPPHLWHRGQGGLEAGRWQQKGLVTLRRATHLPAGPACRLVQQPRARPALARQQPARPARQRAGSAAA